MTIFTYSEANNDLSKLLDKAKNDPEVYIQRENGELLHKTDNLPNLNIKLSREEIVSCAREGKGKR